MSDPWLDQLRRLHDEDKAKHEAEKSQKPEQPPQNRAGEILRKSHAHQLMRDMQKFLLNGGGTLDIFDRAGEYDRGITLVWQGPISEARKPDINDPESYNYILVGVRNNTLWVNGKKLPNTKPDTLKSALLEAGKNPEREKWSKNKS